MGRPAQATVIVTVTSTYITLLHLYCELKSHITSRADCFELSVAPEIEIDQKFKVVDKKIAVTIDCIIHSNPTSKVCEKLCGVLQLGSDQLDNYKMLC